VEVPDEVGLVGLARLDSDPRPRWPVRGVERTEHAIESQQSGCRLRGQPDLLREPGGEALVAPADLVRDPTDRLVPAVLSRS
jgi:hypothetical protein